jgi:sugar lactone lactonase YvrE
VLNLRLGACLLLGVTTLTACSSTDIPEDDPAGGAGGGANNGGSGGAGKPAQPEPTRYLGDGSLESVALVEIFIPQAKVPLSATSLSFNPTVPGELWVTLRQFPSGKPCTEANQTGCEALRGLMAVVSGATGSTPMPVLKEDGNSWHFMRRPTAIAWGDGALFATCGEAYTDNFEDVPVPYAGPVLWSSDPRIFGVEPTAGQNGTHMDMLHETPYCMGIAWEAENAYFAVNGDAGSLDRYDFHMPHQIGGEDHADGEVYRYATGEFTRVPEVPSHAAYDSQRQLVYLADTGGGRIISVDPSTAKLKGEITTYEELHGSGEMDGATVIELVPPGTLQRPSGLAFADDRLFVTDNATSRIHVFDPEGNELESLDTGLPAGSLAGLTLGPDQKVYFSDLKSGHVRCVEPL